MTKVQLIQKISISILWILVFGNYAFSKTKIWEPAYTNISVNDGLPSSEIYYVHQDRNGYMWFCTDHGVVKYDGFRLHVFDKTNGLLDDVILSLYEDHLGRIWFFAYSGQLAYYSPKENKIISYKYNHLLAKVNHGDCNISKDIVVDKECNVYYSGLYKAVKIDVNGKLTHLETKGLRNFTEVNDKWLYEGTFVWKFIESKVIRIVSSSGKEKYYEHPDKIYTCDMVKVNNRNLIFVNDWVIDADNLNNKIKMVGFTGMFDVGGELWVTTLSGAYRYKKRDEFHLSKPDGSYLKNQKITSVTKDHEGGYWFSTLDDGVYYTSNLDILHWVPSDAKNLNTIYDINGFGDQVYYASSFGYYNLKSGMEVFEKKGGSHRIGVWGNKLILSKDLTPLGKASFTKTNWGYESSLFMGWDIDQRNNFYSVGITLNKLNKLTKNGESIIDQSEVYNPSKYKPHFFRSLAIEPNGKMYVGSSVGLFKVKNKKFKRVKLPPDLNRIRVTGMVYHKYWGLIVATRGKGLFFLRNEKVVKRIQMKDGLISDQLNTIYMDKQGDIYIGTNKGISKIVKSKTHSITIFNLTRLTGLSSSEVSCIYVNKEGAYIGTRSGVTLIPASYSWDKHSLENQIRIQTIFSNGKQLQKIMDGMEFNASQKVIRFLLQTTNYKSLHERPYKYRFRNSDPWSFGYNGELILINPSFESYELEIQYENELGVWSKPNVIFHFSISPPFYSTWWFTGLIFVLTLIAGFLLFRNRLKVIQRRNKIQRNMDLLEQKALLAQMNPHFIFNALNSIQSFLLYNENELAERYLSKLSQLIRLTLTNSRETDITILKELDSLKMYLELEQMRFKNKFNFEIDVSVNKEELTRFIPPMLIQPFVENSIIHGFKGLENSGSIVVKFIEIKENKLKVEVVDNGVGYLSNKVNKDGSSHKSYGTQITSERLILFKERYQSAFDYSIEVLTDENDHSIGTKVKISIPVFNKEV
jgi:hypothetical protein